MSDIDWSKAPEGAMYWGPDTPDYCECFYKESSGVWYFASPHNDWEWRELRGQDGPHPDRMKMLIQRPFAPKPTTWDGQGLPPAGTVCEWRGLKGGYWVECEVIAVSNSQIVLKHAESSTYRPGRFELFHLNPLQIEFRPIRTPEQIAAEKMANEIDEICAEIVSHYGAPKMSEHYLGLAQSLHAAGYRKVEVKP